MDGVLAEGPPPSEMRWGRMDGSLRALRRMFLLDWYSAAKLLHDPREKFFWVISARKEDPEVRAVSMRWLQSRFPGRIGHLFLLQGARTIRNVVTYKAQVISREGFTDFVEDNREVVRGVARALPDCRVWLYKDGEISRWPPVVAS